MNKLALLGICLAVAFSVSDICFAAGVSGGRDVPQYSFVQAPDTLSTNYYDYMIGSYNNLPLHHVPDAMGGGYYLCFHGRKTSAATRRVYWAYLDAMGNLIQLSEIGDIAVHEGYPAMALDRETARPLYAWHADYDDDGMYEVMFAYDRVIGGFPGYLTDPVPVIDNPTVILETDDNEFIWPELKIGPSPNPGMQRVYIMAKNLTHSVSTSHPVENVFIAYADFHPTMLEAGAELSWSYTSVPELNAWNQDQLIWRRPFLTMSLDENGNVYLIGRHFALDINDDELDEEYLDVFICSDYGSGDWVYHSYFSTLPSWNPPVEPHSTLGYFTDDEGEPFVDEDLFWQIMNTGHFNAVVDASSRVRALGLWGLTTASGAYLPELQTVKSYVYDPADESLRIRDVHPKGDPANGAFPHFTPWDLQPPWQEVDSYSVIDGQSTPDMLKIFPFAYWDDTEHDHAMCFHYNHLKLSEPNSENMLVAIWQDSQRARNARLYPDQYPEHLPYANSPEIVIACSADDGASWSDPIILNDVDTPELAGLIPMWVYPANTVQYMGMQGNRKVGRLGLMFLNDNRWGALGIWNPHVMPDSCMVMFAELEIVFPEPVANLDPSQSPEVLQISNAYPNPFRDQLSIKAEIKAGDYEFKVFNIKGQCVHEHRAWGKGTLDLSWNGLDAKGKRLPAGIYLLQLKTGGRYSTRKVLKY